MAHSNLHVPLELSNNWRVATGEWCGHMIKSWVSFTRYCGAVMRLGDLQVDFQLKKQVPKT